MSIASVSLMVKRQISSLFGMSGIEENVIDYCVGKAYQRSLPCLQSMPCLQGNKYFHGEIDPLYGVGFTIFLYWLSREVWLFGGASCNS